jgi:RNA polymerase sigma-70 factor (ECF subfamily)
LIDKGIIEGIKSGDTASFGRMIDICLEQCLLLAIRISGNKADAEDIVQEAFIKVWEKRSSIRQAESFIPWIRKIVVNRSYDYLRAKKRNIELIDKIEYINMELISSDSADRIVAEEVINLLEWIGGKLSPKQRVVFVLSEIEGISYKEISKITGLAGSSVKSNCYHAREKVKMIFEKAERREDGKL